MVEDSCKYKTTHASFFNGRFWELELALRAKIAFYAFLIEFFQQDKKFSPDFLIPSHRFQILLGDPQMFLS